MKGCITWKSVEVKSIKMFLYSLLIFMISGKFYHYESNSQLKYLTAANDNSAIEFTKIFQL